MKILNVIQILALIISSLFCCLVYSGTRQHDKSWNIAVITGPLTSNKIIQYYLQPEIDFIDNKYKFQLARLYVGLGYESVPNLTFWLMNGYGVARSSQGDYNHIDIIREQVNWSALQRVNISIANTSRLEERKNSDDSQWAVRFRNMVTMKLPFTSWEGHSLMMFEEVFFNLNHPAWINSNTVVGQNRVFIGVETQFTPAVSLDAGLMNQYIFRNTDESNNVLYLLLRVAG